MNVGDEDQCKFCDGAIFLFDKAPLGICATDEQIVSGATSVTGWATDHCGDVVADFVCPARETSGRYPVGRPHEPKGTK